MEKINSFENKICMITGATSGIGKQIALQAAELGSTVIIVSRNQKKCEKTKNYLVKKTGNKNIYSYFVDLSSIKETKEFVKKFNLNFDRLDILINNAGGRFLKKILTDENLEITFALNHIAPFNLTLLLLDKLNRSDDPRVINVNSDAHYSANINIDDLNFNSKSYNGKLAYSNAKLSNLYFTYEFKKHFPDSNISINAIHPGGVASKFSMNNGKFSWLKHITYYLIKGELLTSKQAAIPIIEIAFSNHKEKLTGKYFNRSEQSKSSRQSYDSELSGKIWDISLSITNAG